MKKVININFQGRVIPIEESAYELLQSYINRLRAYFYNEEGKDEIINDIESRIGELFSEALKKGSPCITDQDVEAIMASIGQPEDFDDDEAKVHSKLAGENGGSQQTHEGTTGTKKLYRDENNKYIGGVASGLANYFNIDPSLMRILFVIGLFLAGATLLVYIIIWIAVPSTATQSIGSVRKRLLRDTDKKFIGGVCSGLAHYFNINVWIPRILFLLPFISFAFRWNHWGPWNFPNFLTFTFSPGTLIIYIILWLVLPEAKSTSDKLEMKGEKVDLNSIKNSISDEMKGVGERVKKFSATSGEAVKEKSRQMGAEVSDAAKKGSRSLGDILVFILKVFAYFIIGSVVIGLIIALFSLAVASTGLLPLKGFIIEDGWQNIFMWGTLILFIWIPVIGIIVWAIRKIARIKSRNNIIRYTFLSLWVVGIICFIGLLSSVANDFTSENRPQEENVYLTNARTDVMHVESVNNTKYYDSYKWLHFEPFADVNADTVFVRNFRLRIVKSTSDSFEVKTVKMANGANRQDAGNTADNIAFDIYQKDSTLQIDNGIPVTRKNKFRNQHVIVTVAVPVGKRIKVNMYGNWFDNVHINFNMHGDWDRWTWDDDDAYKWDDNIEYVMTNDGLKTVHPEDEIKMNDGNDGEKSPEELQNELDDLQNQIQENIDRKQEKMKELEDRKKALEDMLNKNRTDSIKADSATRYRYKTTAFFIPGKKNFYSKANYSGSQKLLFQNMVFNRFLL